MNNSHYTAIAVINVMLTSSIHIVALAIAAIGWQRKRNSGFLILCAWALFNMGNALVLGLGSGLVQSYLTKLFPQTDRMFLAMLPHWVATPISGALLIVGLAMIVFRRPAVVRE